MIQSLKVNATVSALSSLLFISIITNSLDAHAVSAEEVCNQPVFKMWKEQQSERLWSPDEETLKAEQSEKRFTYNCFALRGYKSVLRNPRESHRKCTLSSYS